MPNVKGPMSFTYGGTSFAFLVSESSNLYRSREQGVVASGAGKLKGGTIMAFDTTAKTWSGWAPGAAGPVGILFEDTDASTEAVSRTILARDAEVQRSALFFIGSPTSPQKDTAYAALAAAHIVMR